MRIDKYYVLMNQVPEHPKQTQITRTAQYKQQQQKNINKKSPKDLNAHFSTEVMEMAMKYKTRF